MGLLLGSYLLCLSVSLELGSLIGSFLFGLLNSPLGFYSDPPDEEFL